MHTGITAMWPFVKKKILDCVEEWGWGKWPVTCVQRDTGSLRRAEIVFTYKEASIQLLGKWLYVYVTHVWMHTMSVARPYVLKKEGGGKGKNGKGKEGMEGWRKGRREHMALFYIKEHILLSQIINYIYNVSLAILTNSTFYYT